MVHESWLKERGSGTMECDIYVTLFEMSLNCGRIVAEMCHHLGLADPSQTLRIRRVKCRLFAYIRMILTLEGVFRGNKCRIRRVADTNS